MTALYLLGAPGAGKSTVMARLIEDWTALEYGLLGTKLLGGHLLVNPQGEMAGVLLGRDRKRFPGTDALGMAVHPEAVRWARGLAEGNPWPLILGEGQRLGTAEFLTTLARATDLLVVLLEAEEEVLAARRTARLVGGVPQSPAWVKGATVKAQRAAQRTAEAGVRVLAIDTGVTSPGAAVAIIKAELPWP